MIFARPARETIMQALFNALVSSVQTSFTANTTQNNAQLGSPSTTQGLFIGLPVFGGSIPRGSVIESLSPLTLSLAPTANGSAIEFTTGFLTFSRRFQYPENVSAHPSLFLREPSEKLSWPSSLQEQVIKAEIWIYSKAGENPDIAPITPLNNLLDAVASAFAPDSPTNQFTLASQLAALGSAPIAWCRMNGDVIKDDGSTDANGLGGLMAEVEILVP